MVTIYAWLEIRATYLDEDLHPEIDEKKVFDDIDNLIKKLKYNELKVIEKIYKRRGSVRHLRPCGRTGKEGLNT